MQRIKQLQRPQKQIPFAIVGIILVLAVMLLLLQYSMSNSYQSTPAFSPDIYFEGQYQIGDGPWHTVEKGRHISSTQGDVTLKGQFHMVAPDGEYLGLADPGVLVAIYANHIHITIQEPGYDPYICDIESIYAPEGLCGELCTGYMLMTNEQVTFTFHNNHLLGNENAIDQFLDALAIYADTSFEKQYIAQGSAERNAGMVFAIVAFVLLGTALFSALLQVDGSNRLWLIGLCILFASGYFIYGADGVFFWSDSIIGNTTVLGICMMLYMLCVCTLIASTLKEKLHKISVAAVYFLGASCILLPLLCIVCGINFYDTWLWWAIIQSIVNGILLFCLALEILHAAKGKLVSTIGAAILLLGFEADLAGTALGWWQGGVVCKYIFIILFIIMMVLVWRVIPRNINAARKAREMEAEQKAIRAQLQENRIAIMISQIQPHFIYNTLGAIQHLCKENPDQAAQLVQNFSLYLRGNFSELDNTVPIRFTKELQHVRCYTEIELIRFPDMAVHYDIQTEDFLLPALTVQPLVENAIKHGLMGLEEGGTVTVTAFETPTHYCVKVVDDGVGFDVAETQDERKHIGIRNVRERLQIMCGGSLSVESVQGQGTVALIQIPKEGKNA